MDEAYIGGYYDDDDEPDGYFDMAEMLAEAYGVAAGVDEAYIGGYDDDDDEPDDAFDMAVFLGEAYGVPASAVPPSVVPPHDEWTEYEPLPPDDHDGPDEDRETEHDTRATGYNVDRFVVGEGEDVVDPELVCTVCGGVLRDPVETVCGHVFCRACIDGWRERDSKCPLDRTVLPPGPLPAAPADLRRRLADLLLKCSHCRADVRLDGVEAHEGECKADQPLELPTGGGVDGRAEFAKGRLEEDRTRQPSDDDETDDTRVT